MSVKLYNGYSIKYCDVIEINSFYKELRQRYTDYIFEHYRKLLANRIDHIANKLYIRHYYADIAKGKFGKISEAYKKELQFIENILKDFSNKAKPTSSVLRDFRLGKENNWREILSCESQLFELVIAIIENNFEFSKIDNDPIYEFSGEFCVLPHKNIKDKILMLAYGNLFEKYLQNLIASEKPKDAEFVKKYDFQYYPYWNNVDPDEEVTEEEWNLREKEWTMIFKDSTIPSDTGFSFHCFDENLMWFELKVRENENLILDLMEDRKQKIEKIVDEIIETESFDEFFKNKEYKYSLERTFKKEYLKFLETEEYKTKRENLIGIFERKTILAKKDLLNLDIVNMTL